MKKLNIPGQDALSTFMIAYKKIIGTGTILLALAVSGLFISTSAFADKVKCVEASFTQVQKSNAEVLQPRTGSDALIQFDFTNNTLYGPAHNDAYRYKNVDVGLYKRIYLNSILMFNDDRTSMTRIYLGHNSSKMTTYDCEYKRWNRVN